MSGTSIEEILRSRENRGLKQEALIDQYESTLISFTLNTPGKVKSGELLSRVHAEGMKRIMERLESENIPIIYHEIKKYKTGDEAYLVIDCDAKSLKSITVKMENTHPLGRLFDIDVFDASGQQIKRHVIGVEKRTCVICGGITEVCRHENSHSIDEVIEKYKQIINEFFCK